MAQVNPPSEPSLVATTAVIALTPTFAAVTVPDIPPGDYNTSLPYLHVIVSEGEAPDPLSDAELDFAVRIDQWLDGTGCYTVPGPPPPARPRTSVEVDLNLPEDSVDRVALNIWTSDSEEGARDAPFDAARSVEMYPLPGEFRGPQIEYGMTVRFSPPASGSFLKIELISLDDAHRGPATVVKIP